MTAEVIVGLFAQKYESRGSVTIMPGRIISWHVRGDSCEVSIHTGNGELYSDTIDLDNGRSELTLLVDNAIGERIAFEKELRKCHASKKTGLWKWLRR